ncbi:MAG TPA: hypothetical protein VEP93_02175 [Variovorax sp.]|nr:hypothetical protein [Variovorax sp.]
MVILADFSDTQLQATCKRCEQTLQEGDRFCRYCGQDQLEGDPSAVIDITQPASNGDGEPLEPISAKHAARRNAWREPVSFLEAAGPADAADSRPGGAVAPSRWSMGLAAAVLLALAAALLYDLYLGSKEEPARQAEQASGAAREQAAAPVVDEPPAPALPKNTSTSAAAPKTSIEPAPVVADRKPAEAPAPDASPTAAVAPPPAPAPIAKVIPDLPAPAPATSSSAAPAAEAPSQGTCPPALAAMALCPNR